MFTGIVETVGTVTEVTGGDAAGQVLIAAPAYSGSLQHGESIAVDGVCLTVAKQEGDGFWADLMRITRETTTLGDIAPGAKVNLERALRADSRMGGHIVQGHADGVATLDGRESGAEWEDFVFEVPEALTRYVVAKGSITLNGVSLTVAALDGARVTVSLIPTTITDTTLGGLQRGDRVNLEVDVLAKYVEKMVGPAA